MNITFEIPNRILAQPLSVPFRRETRLAYVIQCDQAVPASEVVFQIGGCSPQNGTASITGKSPFLKSGHLMVRGEAQTEPGHNQQLRVLASIDGQIVGQSEPFSVC